MATLTRKSTVLGLAQTYWDEFQKSIERARVLDMWLHGDQYAISDDPDDWGYGRPYSPRTNDSTDVGDEYNQLSEISPNPWAGLVVKSLSQTAYVDGVRMPKTDGNLEVWDDWQRNRMDRKQIAINKASIGHGIAFGIVMPGKDPLSGDSMPKIVGRSALRCATFYQDDDDEWPVLALDGLRFRDDAGKTGWNVTLYDETGAHYIYCDNDGNSPSDWHYISVEEHPFGVTPVAACYNTQDLDGRAMGEVEPIIPILRRIDQTTFDRLIVQRFGAWKVRYIAGMAKPSTAEATRLQAMRLKMEDLLISTDSSTKFGTLDATPIDGFIASGDTDLRYLAAITQTPPHHLLGLSSNLQAEALAAAESGLQRKSVDFRMGAGEFYEQIFRLCAIFNGNTKEAGAYNMQVRWRETESRSFMQTVQGLAMAATGLKIPIEMLWEKFPGWTDQDVSRAKDLVEDGAMDQLFAALDAANPSLDAEQAATQKPEEPGGATSNAVQ